MMNLLVLVAIFLQFGTDCCTTLGPSGRANFGETATIKCFADPAHGEADEVPAVFLVYEPS